MLSLLEAKQIAGNAYIELKGKDVVLQLVLEKRLAISSHRDNRYLYTVWQYGDRKISDPDVIDISETPDEDYVEIRVDLQTGKTKIFFVNHPF